MAIIKIFENAPVNGAFFNLSFCKDSFSNPYM